MRKWILVNPVSLPDEGETNILKYSFGGQFVFIERDCDNNWLRASLYCEAWIDVRDCRTVEMVAQKLGIDLALSVL